MCCWYVIGTIEVLEKKIFDKDMLKSSSFSMLFSISAQLSQSKQKPPLRMQKQSKDSVQQYHKFLLKRRENNPIKRKKKKIVGTLLTWGLKQDCRKSKFQEEKKIYIIQAIRCTLNKLQDTYIETFSRLISFFFSSFFILNP